ncbi:MAG: hypothetical protein ACLRZZ_04145 [Enterocloster sp.]
MSGGNQQKVGTFQGDIREAGLIVASCSATQRGLDIGATRFVHETLASVRMQADASC